MNLLGTSLGIYCIGAELGRGGMGTVYRAETTADGPAGAAGSVVAVKVFHTEQVEDERSFARFRLEAEIGRETHHPHLVRTYGINSAETNGRAVHFTVMELIEGRSLRALLAELGALPESLLYEIADQVLDALDALHERGVVHRDIKPENIIISPDHRVVLMDLGVARRVTQTEAARAGEFVGSTAYAAPEQFEGVDVGPRADLYALGVSLYEMATGVNPFGGLDMAAVMAAKLAEELAPPRSVYPDLGTFWDRVIQTCVRLQPTERFATASELRRILSAGEGSGWWQQSEGRAPPSFEKSLRRLGVERAVPMVGREAESNLLRSAQARAASNGGVLLLSGAVGVGKSRLLYEHLESVVGAGGPLLGVGRAVGSGGRGFGAFLEALRDLLVDDEDDASTQEATLQRRLRALLPEAGGVVASLAAFVLGTLQPGPESGFSKDALFGAVADVLRSLSAERLLVLVVEDVHLAGAETAELFAHLVRCVPAEAILLVGVFDSGALDEASPLQDALRRAEEEDGVDHIELASLSDEHTEDLVRAVVRSEPTTRALGPMLRTRSEGNPLLALELLSHLRAIGILAEDAGRLVLTGSLGDVSVPSTVRDLVRLRLAGLDEDQRELLETAATLGISFEIAFLAQVLEEEPIKLLQSLAALEKKHRLLASSGKDAFRFAHHTVYETIYESIPPSLREEYHSLIADTLLEDDEGDRAGAGAYDLLRHLFLAERALEAEPFVESALDHMGASVPAGEGAAFLERVAEAFASAAAQTRLAIAMRLWAFHEMRGSRQDETRVLEEAGALADALGEPEPRARVHALRAGTFWYAGDYDSAFEQAQSGLECAREAGSRIWEATCLHTLGVVAFRRGQVQACVDKWRAALALRREIDDRRGIASTLQALALVMRAIGEEDKVLPTMREALEIWREIGERRGEAAMLMNVGNHFVDSARYEEGLGYLERALRMHRDAGALMNEAVVSTNLGHALNFLGRIDEAHASWERALGIFVDHGNPNGELAVRTMLGGALAEYGEDDLAQEHLDAAVALAERTGNRAKLALAHRALGQLHHDTGARVEGWTHLDAALAIERELEDASGRVLSLGLVGRAALAENDFSRALEALSEALEDARDIEALAPLILCRLARAELGAGHAEDARTHAREALERAEASQQISTRDGPEIFYALYVVLGEPRLLARARELLEERAAAVRHDTYREHLLTRAWPAPEIREQSEGPAASAASP